jgi:hypothetical protein
LVEYFSNCPGVSLCIWKIILVNQEDRVITFALLRLALKLGPGWMVWSGARQQAVRSDRSGCALPIGASAPWQSESTLLQALPPSFGI